jgi:hypothetical protein
MRFVILLMLFLYGCPSISTQQFNDALDADRQQVKLISSSMGQRTFDVSQGKLIKALINAFSEKNLTVLTLEKDAGFIMAEGPQFLNTKTLLRLHNERNTKLNSQVGNPVATTPWSIPNVSLRVAANLYEKEGGKTLVKLKVSSIYKNCFYFPKGIPKEEKTVEQNCPVFPTMASLWYQQLWDEIEKSIFMQRETILN